jgi:flagellar protein FlbD
VIVVHRLKGEQVVVNADLIETVEACPDTTIALVDGRRITVRDRPEDIVARVREFRASILAAADELRHRRPARLTVVPPAED